MLPVLGLSGSAIGSFKTKAEALHFAIVFTATLTESGNEPNYNKAQTLFDFITRNVELPDVRPNPADGLVEFAKAYIEKLAKDKEKVL